MSSLQEIIYHNWEYVILRAWGPIFAARDGKEGATAYGAMEARV